MKKKILLLALITLLLMPLTTFAKESEKYESKNFTETLKEEEIKLKNKDMENTIELVQYTRNGSNDIYFDYILNSSTTTELMTRQSRIQQIASHTQEELIELEKLIDENKELQIQLEKDNVTLTNSISEYEKQVEELEKYIDSVAQIGLEKTRK